MISPSYAEKSREARAKYHMDDEDNQKFDQDLKCLERKLDRSNHSLELGHAVFTLINTILLVYLIAKLT